MLWSRQMGLGSYGIHLVSGGGRQIACRDEIKIARRSQFVATGKVMDDPLMENFCDFASAGLYAAGQVLKQLLIRSHRTLHPIDLAVVVSACARP
jgi:hypothetical protein